MAARKQKKTQESLIQESTKPTITYPLRIPRSDYEQIQQKALGSNLTIGEFLRRAALRRQISVPNSNEEWQFHSQLAQLKMITHKLKNSSDNELLIAELESLHLEMWRLLQRLMNVTPNN